MIKTIDYYPEVNSVFNKGKSGFYATYADGTERQITEQEAQKFVDIANKAVDRFMGRTNG